jgi:hypothetical protein
MSMAAFTHALIAEIGSVATVVRRDTFVKIVSDACDCVIKKMKEESGKALARGAE